MTEHVSSPTVRIFRVRSDEAASALAKDATYHGKPDLPLQGPVDGVLDQPLASFKQEVLDGIKSYGVQAAIRNQKNPVLLVGGLVQSAEMYVAADVALPDSSNELFFAMIAGGFGGKVNAITKGATAEHAAIALIPLKTMKWDAYEKLVGTGVHLPVNQSLRDVSDKMTFVKHGEGIDGSVSVVNLMGDAGLISGQVNANGQLQYLVIKGRGDAAVHGDELFVSMVKRFRDNGVDIQEVKGLWNPSGSGLDTNWHQFMDTVQTGATSEQAAMQTFTGKQAQKLGMTRVEVLNADESIANQSAVDTIYRKTDWGESKEWADFANNWVSSMSRDLFGRAAQVSESKSIKQGSHPSRGVDEPASSKVHSEALPPHSLLETDTVPGSKLSLEAQAIRASMLNHIEGSGRGADEKAIFMAQVDKNLEQSASRGEKIPALINMTETVNRSLFSPDVG